MAPTEFPDDENGQALRSMAEQGVDLDSPRIMDFEHVFPKEASARGFNDAVAGTVLDTIIYEPEDNEQGAETGWEVQCRVRMVPTHTDITATESRLAAVAERFGGQADGWGTMSSPDGSPDV